jgi:hypothetical protein
MEHISTLGERENVFAALKFIEKRDLIPIPHMLVCFIDRTHSHVSHEHDTHNTAKRLNLHWHTVILISLRQRPRDTCSGSPSCSLHLACQLKWERESSEKNKYFPLVAWYARDNIDKEIIYNSANGIAMCVLSSLARCCCCFLLSGELREREKKAWKSREQTRVIGYHENHLFSYSLVDNIFPS